MTPFGTKTTHHRDTEGTEKDSSKNLSDLRDSVVNNPTESSASPRTLTVQRNSRSTTATASNGGYCRSSASRALGAEKGQKEGEKGADKGIDGIMVFTDDNSGKAKRVMVSVKSGHGTPAHIRDLGHVIDRK